VLHLWIYRSSKAQEWPARNEQADFSLSRYEPMARLMSDEDLVFLKAQPGFKPEIGQKFIRERRRIFRLYLRELAGEFHRLHAHARAVVASLPSEHSPLVGMLLRQQLRFWYEMAAVEMRLSLDTMGVGAFAGSLDAQGLVSAIGRMHEEIGRLAAPAAA
jgi:hypothetical protein